MRTFKMMAFGALAIGITFPAQAQEREIPVTYRDFRGIGTTHTGSDPANAHPDFENRDAYCWNFRNVAPAPIGFGIGPQVDPGLDPDKPRRAVDLKDPVEALDPQQSAVGQRDVRERVAAPGNADATSPLPRSVDGRRQAGAGARP